MKNYPSKFLFLSLLFLTGCFMHTVVGSNYYYPPDSNAQNADYHLWITVHGEKRKAYTAKTKKKIIVGIDDKHKNNLFLREYECEAAGLNADVFWPQKDDLEITFFDFQEGVSIYKRDEAYTSGKIIFKLQLTYLSELGAFSEKPISDELKSKIQKAN